MRRHLPKIRLALFLLAALAILWLSLDPRPYLPKNGPLSWDKAQHALAYAFLTLVGGWALQPLMDNAIRAFRWAAGIAIIYGVLLEFAQMLLTRNRSAQLADAIADALGAVAVYLLVWLLVSLRATRNQPERY